MTKNKPRTMKKKRSQRNNLNKANDDLPRKPIGHYLNLRQVVERAGGAVAHNAENAGPSPIARLDFPSFFLGEASMTNSAAQRMQSGGTGTAEAITR